MNNEVQAKLAELQQKGWTLAALADELAVTPNAIEKWKSGDRHPSNTKSVLVLLGQLAKRKRIPKKRRYAPNSRTGQKNYGLVKGRSIKWQMNWHYSK